MERNMNILKNKFFIPMCVIFVIGLTVIQWMCNTRWEGDIEKDLVIRIRPDQIPRSYNPLMQFETKTLKMNEIGAAFSECVFEGLFNRVIDKKKQPTYENGLAENIWSEDLLPMAKRWNVKLKSKSYWHGDTTSRITSSDVIHTYRCIEYGASDSPWRGRLLRYLDEVPHSFHDDDLKIEFVFKRKLFVGDVKKLLTFKIIPEAFKYDNKMVILTPENMPLDTDENWRIFNKICPIGSGPYIFDELKSGINQIVLKKNPSYNNNLNIPRYVVFKEVNDDDLVSSIGKDFNMMLYTPNKYRTQIERVSNVKTYEYTPFYFYSIVFGKQLSIDQKNQILCTIDQDQKSEFLKHVGFPSANGRFINSGPFPWNWDVFDDSNPYEGKNYQCPKQNSKKTDITILFNKNDIRTEAIIIQISIALNQYFNIKSLDMPEVDFMKKLRQKSFDLALIIWEGFDQDYSISKLYTEEENPMNLTFINFKKMKKLNSLFTRFSLEVRGKDRYKRGKKIHRFITDEAPYLYLFTPPRRAAYLNSIRGIDNNPIHPETFLSNIKKWIIAQ